MVFYFLKQKTAYEMRISDWISDVCSSDLFPILFPTKGETGRTLSPAYPYAKARFLAEVAQRQPNPAFLHECPVQEIMMSRFGIYRANFPPIDLKLFGLGLSAEVAELDLVSDSIKSMNIDYLQGRLRSFQSIQDAYFMIDP